MPKVQKTMKRNVFDNIISAPPKGHYEFVEYNGWEGETWRTYMKIPDKRAIRLIHEIIKISDERSDRDHEKLPSVVRGMVRTSRYDLSKADKTEKQLDKIVNESDSGYYFFHSFGPDLDSKKIEILQSFLDRLKADPDGEGGFLHKKGLFDILGKGEPDEESECESDQGESECESDQGESECESDQGE